MDASCAITSGVPRPGSCQGGVCPREFVQRHLAATERETESGEGRWTGQVREAERMQTIEKGATPVRSRMRSAGTLSESASAMRTRTGPAKRCP